MAVPSDLIGINSQDWPHVASPAPAFNFGHYHTIDNKRVHWNALHTAAGTYSWTAMDTLVAALGGKPISYCHIGTPTYLAQPNQLVQGPYTGVGEASYPTNLSDMAAFYTQLLTRYPTISVVQCGNEPFFSGTNYTTFAASAAADTATATWDVNQGAATQVFLTSTGTLPGGLNVNTVYYLKTAYTKNVASGVQLSLTSGGTAVDITSVGTGTHTMYIRSTFAWKTPEQQVDECNAVIQACKAVRPGIICTTPAVYDEASFATFLDATGTVCGLKGWQLAFDGLAIHPYNADPNPRSFQNNSDIANYPYGGIKAFRKLMTLRGAPSLPVYVTEYGVASRAIYQRIIEFNAMTAAQRRNFMARLGIAAARLGVKQFSFFSFGSNSNLCGDMSEVGGSGAGIGDAHNAVAGKTLLAGAGYTTAGVEQGTCSDGSSYSI